ncbi:hypothetical protein [Cohaesibacter haloalkalitolerans]|uniref:hypothetical protein n=1 Tax=Cohaesibacter haloalkalitolerans TaxID=1162980 RepID=UPI000E64DBFA|nr:hypothetical protein [Cohaesibacter haloalkalitolerans]
MIKTPDETLTVKDVVFSFDAETLRVKVGMVQGQGLDDLSIVGGLAERLPWLWQWSYWIDRHVDPLRGVSEDLRAEDILRALFDYSASAGGAGRDWLRIGALPRLSRWSSLVAQQGWLPRRLRSLQGKRIHAHRQAMAGWLDGEVDRWEVLREEMATDEQTEGPFEAYMGHLRRQIESGTFTLEVRTAFQALLRSVSPLMEIVEIKSSDSENLILMLKVLDEDGQLSRTRHQPAEALDRLVGVSGPVVAEQRVREMAYRIAILVSEMLQMMHCRRNQVAMAFILSHDRVSKPVFALTFKATLLLTYRSQVLSMIGRRRIPDLPVCKNLKFDEF